MQIRILRLCARRPKRSGQHVAVVVCRSQALDGEVGSLAASEAAKSAVMRELYIERLHAPLSQGSLRLGMRDAAPAKARIVARGSLVPHACTSHNLPSQRALLKRGRLQLTSIAAGPFGSVHLQSVVQVTAMDTSRLLRLQ